MNETLLIKTATNVENLCTAFDKFDAKLDSHIEYCNERMDQKADMGTVKWLIGILVTIMIITGSVVGVNKTWISEHQIFIDQNQKNIEKLQQKVKCVDKNGRNLVTIQTDIREIKDKLELK